MRPLLRQLPRSLTEPRTCLAIIAAVFAASRLFFWVRGLRFDAEPLKFHWQYVDPALLQHDLWRSIFYLEQQPPAYNLFLGAILHLAPRHPAVAYHATYLCLGLALSLSLFALMDRMNVDRRIALAVALVFTLSPSALLFENLLSYEYPLTSLFCIAALFLHRYAGDGRTLDAFILFSCLALISGIRAICHLAWFAAIAAFVVFALPRLRRQTLLALSVPAILLVLFYAKHIIVFRNLVPGQGIYGAINWEVMATSRLPQRALEPLVASGKISPVLKTKLFSLLLPSSDTDVSASAVALLVPFPPKTGVPVRDECVKSTGAFNLNCVWVQNFAKIYQRDSLVVLRTYPKRYVQAVIANILRYCLPDTANWPFDGRTDDPNAKILSRPLAIYDLVTSGIWPPISDRPWLRYIAMPGLILLGCFILIRRFGDVLRERRKIGDPSFITLSFVMFNTLF